MFLQILTLILCKIKALLPEATKKNTMLGFDIANHKDCSFLLTNRCVNNFQTKKTLSFPGDVNMQTALSNV